ncbi:isochorismate synthase [Bacillus sp. B15-48]|uniref:isochorismate synthase n=1 Tax=Bacillus sp. B15-48 TaxID=1548601 RepID=UPI00193EEC4B|nr:isochorismate synthase [Bacillus sp. B15-48]MBM4762664.1 isochorismate synthase [Bacillus sp. B15-48]
MATIQDTELRQAILAAIDRARENSHAVLVSEVQRIERVDPFNFFATGRKRFLGERFYWQNPKKSQILVGMGIAKQIQSNQMGDRFADVEKQWEDLIDKAILIGEEKELATGPVIFGGFSFDPLKKKTGLWSKYEDALFHIPTFMLSVVNGQSFLTTNIICTQQDDLRLFERISKDRQFLLAITNQNQEFPYAPINRIIEVQPEEWKKSVSDLVRSLQSSELKKVVLAREVRLFFDEKVEIERTLSHLIAEQKESYIFAFESCGDCFIGATPERLVKIHGNEVFSTCLAGSIARGKTEEEDRELGQTLLNDQKNLIEHQYVVEMIKEAMDETCEQISLPGHPKLLKTKHIQHLYTPVVGKKRNGTSMFDLVNRLHPTPALGGFPKEAAVAEIRESEELDRGFYAAPIGWHDYRENGEFAVAIRSALVQGKEASLFAGCGVVADSDAESEFIETRIKFQPMLTALGGKWK